MKIRVKNEDLILLPEKALYWPDRKILVTSDLHLGKAESMQAAGVPVPSGLHLEDLDVLGTILNRYDVDHILILGDFIHNRFSWTVNLHKDIQTFIKNHDHIQWTLIYGNHEKGSVEKIQSLPFHFVEEDLFIEPFLFTHGHKTKRPETFHISGHIHPQITLKKGPLKLRLPCFHVQGNELTLPAFGSLTGGYSIKAKPTDRVFAVGDREVFEVPT